MRAHRHLLRDVFWLTLPVAVLLVYLVVVSAVDVFNAEIRNFHGYPVHSLRLAGPKEILRRASDSFVRPRRARYISHLLTDREERAKPGPLPLYDLRVRGVDLDALNGDIPRSAKEWHPAKLVSGSENQRVEIHYRGQMMSHYFWDRKSWKLKTKKRELLDGYRIINLTPIDRRLMSHLTFLVGRETGLPTPRSRPVRLFVNLQDQGLYLQEEQIDETMLRRNRRMPGDIFYGEAVVPVELKRSSSDLFWNPYTWRKKARHNRYPEAYRPYLTDLLDALHDPDPASFDRVYSLLDMDLYPLYYAILCFQGDQHINHSHNHKIFFNPLTGKFEGFLWNPLMRFPVGDGVETIANRLFRKFARDPRFLDRVHRLIQDKMLAKDLTAAQLEELERIQREYGRYTSNRGSFDRLIAYMSRVVTQRGDTVRQLHSVARASFRTERAPESTLLRVYATGVASLRLRGVTLDGPAAGAVLIEDRDFDGKRSARDRVLDTVARGNELRLEAAPALLYTGRDFRASYREMSRSGADSFEVPRDYTRLAPLESPFLLLRAPGQSPPRVTGLDVVRTVGEGPVDVALAEGEEESAKETVHPWRLPEPRASRTLVWSGEVRLTEDLVIPAADKLQVEPGAKLLLGPGVSVVVKCRAEIENLTVRRLDPLRPWGVFVLQGEGANHSVLKGCDMSGGSEDTIGHVYYSGMFSVHYADRVSVENCVFADNVLGDDTVRFARCDDLLMKDVRVRGANGDAIDCDLCTGRIEDTVVDRPRNDGIDLMTSIVHLERIRVTGAGDKGISFGEGADPEVREATIVGCVSGMGIKDGSAPRISNSVIRDCRVALDCYDKNWRYPGGGRGTLTDCVLKGNGKDARLDLRSSLTLIRCRTNGRYEFPENFPPEQFKEVDPQGAAQ